MKAKTAAWIPFDRLVPVIVDGEVRFVRLGELLMRASASSEILNRSIGE